MTFRYTPTNHPWVTLRKGDASFQLRGSVYVADRAVIEFDRACPQQILEQVGYAVRKGWIKVVANVPDNDPTLIWDTLKK